MDAVSYLRQYKERSLKTIELIPEEQVEELILQLKTARERDKQVFICGNGGSASTASHLANDLGKGASLKGKKRFRVISLTDNIPWMTALANDLDYGQVFVEQLKNYAEPGDVLIAISGSGNSKNVLEAVSWANEHGLMTIGMTGRPGGDLGKLAKSVLFVESSHMGQIEDGHFLAQHMIGYYFMEADNA